MMKRKRKKRVATIMFAVLMLLSILGNSASGFATSGEPTEEYVKTQMVNFTTTTYTVQIGTFSQWNNALSRYQLAKSYGWNPYMKYEKVGNTWYYKVWTLHTTSYAEAEAEFNKLVATPEGKELFDNAQLRIYEYLCPYVEVRYQNYKGEEQTFKLEIRGNSYEEDDVGLYNPKEVINSVAIDTNSGSQYVGEFFRYDVKFAESKPNYQFELIYPERFEQAREPEITKTATGLNEKWVFYLTDNLDEKTSLQGSKTWNDEGHEENRPSVITVNLLANGNIVESKDVTAADNWEFSFEDIPKYVAGEIATYTVSEEPVKYYTTEVIGTNIVNTYDKYQETVTIQGTKTWIDEGNEDKRPESITVRLFADGVEAAAKNVTAADDWTYVFEDVPKYNEEKNEIVYTISEDAVDNYTTKVDGYNIENAYIVPEPEPEPEPEQPQPQPETVTIQGTKTWNDEGHEENRPESITVRLFANGQEVAVQEVKASSAGAIDVDVWTYEFYNMPKYNEDSSEIVYTISEDSVANYTTEINEFYIVNTYVVPTPDPSPEPNPTPVPTPDPVPDPNPTPVPTPDPVPVPKPDPIPVPQPEKPEVPEEPENPEVPEEPENPENPEVPENPEDPEDPVLEMVPKTGENNSTITAIGIAVTAIIGFIIIKILLLQNKKPYDKDED